jgi:hypothetical protein
MTGKAVDPDLRCENGSWHRSALNASARWCKGFDSGSTASCIGPKTLLLTHVEDSRPLSLSYWILSVMILGAVAP